MITNIQKHYETSLWKIIFLKKYSALKKRLLNLDQSLESTWEKYGYKLLTNNLELLCFDNQTFQAWLFNARYIRCQIYVYY